MSVTDLSGRRRADALFREHGSWLNRWARRQTKTGHVFSSEDIASEVFLRLLSLDLDNLREPRAMMTTIARRVVYELRRRNDLWTRYESDLLAMPEVLAASPEDHAIIVEALRAVDRTLAALKPKAKAAFLYSRLDGMKQKDIAAKLGISVKTAEKYIAQGMVRAYALKKDLL